MAEKRLYGFDDTTLGSMLKFNPYGGPNHKGQYELKDSMTELTTRTNLPDGLIKYLKRQAKDDFKLTQRQLNELSNAKLIDFWLFQQIDDIDQRNTMIRLFDTKSGVLRVLQERYDAQQSNLQAKNFTDDDRNQLNDIDEKISQTMTGMNEIWKQQRILRRETTQYYANIYRTVVWTLARQLGWADPKLPLPGDTERLSGTMNSDNYLKLCRAMETIGKQEVKRMEENRNGKRV